ncbi:hypothetical protein D3C85_1931350 [compost metagenome]
MLCKSALSNGSNLEFSKKLKSFMAVVSEYKESTPAEAASNGGIPKPSAMDG